MPLPLVPVLFVAGAAAIGLNESGHVPGAVSAPDEQKPDTPVTKPTRPPPAPYIPPAPAQPRPGGDPLPGDPVSEVFEAGVGIAEGAVKTAVVGAAAVAGASILAGGGLTGAAGAAAASIGTTASGIGSAASTAASTAAGAVQVLGPAIGAVGAAAGIVVGAIDIFGGDVNLAAILGENAAGMSDADFAHYQALVAAGGTQAGEGFLLQVQNRLGTKQITTTAGTVTLGRRAAEFVAGADPSEVVEINPVTHRPLAAEVFTKPGER